MLKINESAAIPLANAPSQLRRRTAASIAPKPIACGRQKFNAIASTNPASSTEQVRCKKTGLGLPATDHWLRIVKSWHSPSDVPSTLC
jgi:hypothetical protein